MYIYIYIYVYIYIYIYVCVCVCVCIYIHTYIHIYVYIFFSIHIYIHIYIYTFTYLHTYSYIYVGVCGWVGLRARTRAHVCNHDKFPPTKPLTLPPSQAAVGGFTRAGSGLAPEPAEDAEGRRRCVRYCPPPSTGGAWDSAGWTGTALGRPMRPLRVCGGRRCVHHLEPPRASTSRG